MRNASVVTCLFMSAVISGCGGSGSDEDKASLEKTTELKTEHVAEPDCTDTATELAGCWASECEVVNDDDQTSLIYGRSVIAFADNGQLREYLQAFDNANCVSPALHTTQLLTHTTYELTPRVDGEDVANIDGHIEFDLQSRRLPEGFPEGAESIVRTPYDVTAEGALCLDTDRVSYDGMGGGFVLTGAPTDGINYENCLERLEP